MSFDYLDIRKDVRKDTLNFKHLTQKSVYLDSGVLNYSLSHKSSLDVSFNPHTDVLRVKGSLPYFLRGHNFKTTNQDFINSLMLASDMLNVDLSIGEVLAFEYGAILETDIALKEIFANHIRVKDMKTLTYDYGKYFEDKILRMKMYNVKANMQNKLSLQIRNEAERDYGYDKTKNYLKIEDHYKRPEPYFKERGIKVMTLLDEDFEINIKNEVLTNYQRIEKTGVIEIPNDKGSLTTPTLLLLALKELEMIYGFNANETVSNIIKSIPNDVLNKNDKKGRRSQIKRLSNALNRPQGSKYDLTELLVATMT